MEGVQEADQEVGLDLEVVDPDRVVALAQEAGQEVEEVQDQDLEVEEAQDQDQEVEVVQEVDQEVGAVQEINQEVEEVPVPDLDLRMI